MEQPRRLMVIVYQEHETAVRAFEKVRELDREGRMHVEDAAVVQAHDDGRLEVVSTHRHAVKNAGKAAFWGLLLGGVMAVPVAGLLIAGGIVGLGSRMSDNAREKAFAERVSALLVPGRSGLFVTGTAGSASADELIAELAPLGGELAQSSLLSETEEKLRRALREAGETAGDAAEDAPAVDA